MLPQQKALALIRLAMYHADGSKIHPRRKSRRTIPRTNLSLHLNKEQLNQLQEAFNLIDQDRDGVISKDDLERILVSLGQKPTEKQIREMLSEVPGNVDFARFVSMFASKMGAADPEDLIRNAFTCFDDDCDGVINLDEFKEMLMTTGSRLTEQQVDEVFMHGTLTDDESRFKCDDIVKLLKYGE
ncbi:Myosin regulatory light polypeptide 9 [Acropora cervicornis]|uniref:Myosin regulatory light polypeptide 9 n=2 Tax=Acropora TaxID=6127 RepID=A0AAD9QXV3_ACRCE|nr:Myosin regulatory light polypeptide 9 [Acropora cervicornis]